MVGIGSTGRRSWATEDDWRRCVDVLRERYPTWEFNRDFTSAD